MSQASISELTRAAASAEGPSLTPTASLKIGGVDPLGLRQLNFDLMDLVLPGLNNVARHVRPFVVVAWAWRRAAELAKARGATHVNRDEMQDFVDRIEVLYVASQLLRNPDADLPGSDYLKPLFALSTFRFEGDEWQKIREVRRYSTALSAPISYGPGLKALGWLVPDAEHPWLMCPSTAVTSALDAFEAQIAGSLNDDALRRLGPVTVDWAKARGLADAWALEDPTEEEKRVFAQLLFGSQAPGRRQRGGALMLLAAQAVGDADVGRIRAAMAGELATFSPPAHLLATQEAWRRVQVRQLFRLALEGLLHWTIIRLESGPLSIDQLVKLFMTDAPPTDPDADARAWLLSVRPDGTGPTEQLARIGKLLDAPEAAALVQGIVTGIAIALAEPSGDEDGTESSDRLPLSRARREADVRANGSVFDFVRHVLESWVLAQHASWSIGRALADARAGGKVLLRLKVILDEGGWTLAPGATRGIPPRPTPDRLQTAISLAQECDLLAAE